MNLKARAAETLKAQGWRDEQIAGALDIHPRTLRRYRRALRDRASEIRDGARDFERECREALAS